MENVITAPITSVDELAVVIAQVSNQAALQIGPADVCGALADVIGFLLAAYIRQSDDERAIADLVGQIKASAQIYRLARAEVGGNA